MNWSCQNPGRLTQSFESETGIRSRSFSTARRRSEQGGFILLVIFMLAAAVALMMYAQLPRVAFESEREKEQLLIDRGEQYTRAIQLFYASTGGYPQSIAALEDTNNKRFLRRRYKDPYTGKEEWRLIHSNGSQLTDSLVQKPPDVNGQPATTTTTATPQNGNPQNQAPQVNQYALQRPSDRTQPGADTYNAPNNPFPQQQVQNNPQQTINGQQPNQVTGFGLPGGLPNGITLPGGAQTSGANSFLPGQPNSSVQTNNAAQNNPQGFQPQFPGQQFAGQPPLPGGTNTSPGQLNSGQTGQNGNTGFQQQFAGQQFVGQQFPGQAPPPGFQVGPNGQLVPVGNSLTQPLQPGQQYAGQPLTGQYDQTSSQRTNNNGAAQPAGIPGIPGAAGGAPGGAGAIDMINKLLLQPRPNPTATASNSALGTSTGGIAGVASTFTGPSIKTYKDRNKYEEWEFVYTPQTAAGAVGGAGAGGRGGNGGTGGGAGGLGGAGGGVGGGALGGAGGAGGSGLGGGLGGGFPPTNGLGAGSTAPTNTGGFPIGPGR